MPVLSFLGGLVVVRRGGEDRVDSRPCRDFLSLLNRILRGVRRRPSNNRHASSRHLDRYVNDAQPFVVRQSRSLARGPAGNQKINARLKLPSDQVAQGSFVNGAVLVKRGDQRGTASTQLHRD